MEIMVSVNWNVNGIDRMKDTIRLFKVQGPPKENDYNLDNSSNDSTY